MYLNPQRKLLLSYFYLTSGHLSQVIYSLVLAYLTCILLLKCEVPFALHVSHFWLIFVSFCQARAYLPNWYLTFIFSFAFWDEYILLLANICLNYVLTPQIKVLLTVCLAKVRKFPPLWLGPRILTTAEKAAGRQSTSMPPAAVALLLLWHVGRS